ncbi:5-formyltetrahydrofolate cyclo-ligase [Stratiformator vulcanicus]|uniref:5-formyltetrahydrofolate cyclo-ligase n=1 Tax=Stratiformator vulcanicus TaxID=2527980 RepID=A0A517QWW0_9PLAN|nr:5-formyltetrahydrofolate cyclo-ligase [Stratiformator vulcanicus]QDT36156.1 putative 5-formyltetrahydrofolate cyclo-ligase [Stratiformator vulcanicus]
MSDAQDPIEIEIQNEIGLKKAAARREVLARRTRQPNKDPVSRQILNRALAMAEYRDARTVLFYVDIRSEVRTRDVLPIALKSPKRIAVPWCRDDGTLALFHLRDMAELKPGKYGILEPDVELRSRAERRIDPHEVDLALVPGVAFTLAGDRLGYGKGYYDRLLAEVKRECHLIGLAFECQIVPDLPTGEHDRRVHAVLTEAGRHSS